MESEQAPKLSRQQRRAQERAAVKQPVPSRGPMSLEAYRDTLIALSQRLQDGLARAQALSGQIEDRFDDASWRDQFAAEARSWRAVSDDLPSESPKSARGLHVRTQRWLASAAEIGDGIADAIAATDRVRVIHLTTEGFAEVNRLAREATQSADFLAERTRPRRH